MSFDELTSTSWYNPNAKRWYEYDSHDHQRHDKYDTSNPAHPLHTHVSPAFGFFQHPKLIGLSYNGLFSFMLNEQKTVNNVDDNGNSCIKTILEYYGYTYEEIKRNEPYFVDFESNYVINSLSSSKMIMISFVDSKDLFHMAMLVVNNKPHFGKNNSELKSLKDDIIMITPIMSSEPERRGYWDTYIISNDFQQITIRSSKKNNNSDIFTLNVSDLLKFFKFTPENIIQLGKCEIKQIECRVDNEINYFYIESEHNLIKPVVRLIQVNHILLASIDIIEKGFDDNTFMYNVVRTILIDLLERFERGMLGLN